MITNKVSCSRYALLSALVALVAALAITGSASAAARGGLPPAFGRLCGHVKGAAWRFQGHQGTQYNVTAPAGVCAIALRSVADLTRQTPHAGAVGSHTLAGPHGYRCAGSGIPLAHAGFCGGGNNHFVWAPRLP